MNLYLILLIPLITALAILPFKSKCAIRNISFAGGSVQLLLSLFLLYKFQLAKCCNPTKQILFEQKFSLFPTFNINFSLGVDGLSVAMILLTSFVLLAGILVSWNVEKMTKEFYFLLLLLAFGAFGFFISFDLFVMFFFLEVAVIPKYLLIGIWGSGNKNYAANKLALMLMGGSALILVGVLGLYFIGGKSFDIINLATKNFPADYQAIIFPLLFVGFGVFTALFPFHTWVPDGHSSAPTAGSMFLAGISMKLGGYGCLRVAMYLLPEGAKQYATIIIVLATIAIFYGAFATMMQKDLKYMNAYSSVSHVGFSLLGLGMLTTVAVNGAVLQMISHGLMTALFFAAIGMVYDRTHTRIINDMSGLLKAMPFIGTIFFVVGLCSLGLPGLSGFVAEMTVFVGSWQQAGLFYRVATILATMSIVVTAVYILRATGKVMMGPLSNNEQFNLKDATWNEKLAAIILLVGILSIGIYPQWLNDLIKPATELMIQRMR